MTQTTTEHEQTIRAAFDQGDLEETANATLRAFGEEIFGFICSRFRQRDDADEAFSMFSEDLWTSLPRFGWRCSMRTWVYALARNATLRLTNAPSRRLARNQPLSLPGAVSQVACDVRTATHMYQKTGVKDRFRSLRERLDQEDQMLLILRVDCNMEWRDLAIALSGDLECNEEHITRTSARLRKAFERLKYELRSMAEADGLLAPR